MSARCWISCCFILVSTVVLVTLGLVSFFQQPKFTITNATLTKFTYNVANNTLDYNLSLNMTIRNPKKGVGIYYRRFQVIGGYRKTRFARTTLNTFMPFYQGRKNTTELHQVVLKGSHVVRFGEKERSSYKTESGLGLYSIKVQLALRVKTKLRVFTSASYKSCRIINCKLKVPLSSSSSETSSTSAGGFKATRCENVYKSSCKLIN